MIGFGAALIIIVRHIQHYYFGAPRPMLAGPRSIIDTVDEDDRGGNGNSIGQCQGSDGQYSMPSMQQ